ncbi:MAG: type I-MYXAN CRISPR-associated protein Cas6/Cmx6 [Deltaproteobacteria bacterium]|nr:type I-MYXAN CRISPR-associated protein Cas6/Cmx6 [Deltaproteobacteria bacterium]
MAPDPKVDLSFLVTGQRLPVDHGYALYGALCRLIPALHDDADTAVGLVRGRYVGGGLLDITPRAELTLRTPVGGIPSLLPLAGKTLDLDGHRLRIGVPQTRALVPAVALYAHLVTTKNGNDQARFMEEIARQALALGVKGRLTVGARRTFGVHGKQVVGYSVLASELTAEESIALQENGLGGRRKMGCGFFEARDR